MLLFRLLGYLLALAGFGFLIVDGATSIADDRLRLTALGQTWYNIDPASLNVSQAAIERYVHPFLWDPIIATVLLWPTFAVALVLGLIFVVVGRPRQRRTRESAWY